MTIKKILGPATLALAAGCGDANQPKAPAADDQTPVVQPLVQTDPLDAARQVLQQDIAGQLERSETPGDKATVLYRWIFDALLVKNGGEPLLKANPSGLRYEDYLQGICNAYAQQSEETRDALSRTNFHARFEARTAEADGKAKAAHRMILAHLIDVEKALSRTDVDVAVREARSR